MTSQELSEVLVWSKTYISSHGQYPLFL